MSSPVPTPTTENEITTFLSSQLSSFKTFLQSRSRDELTGTAEELNKEIALHNTRMLKVVSDFNKQNPNQTLTPGLPVPSGLGEWDDITGRDDNPFVQVPQRGGYNKEGGRNLFASHHPGIFNRRGKKGYVKAGASTLFRGSGSGGGGGGFERRLFGYGLGFDDYSSEGSVDEEEEGTPSKRPRSGNGKREKQSGWEGKGKKNGEAEGERVVVILDSSEGEGEGEVDGDERQEARNVMAEVSSGISKTAGGGEDNNAATDTRNSAHQKRMNWILEMTGRKRKGDGEEEILEMEMGMKRGRGRPRKNIEMEMGAVDTAKIKRGRGRPRKIEILE